MDLTTTSETFGADDQRWLGGSHGQDSAESIMLDTSAFTSGTHYPQGFFRSGLPLGKITASGKYAPYNDAASDGTEVLAGFLMTPVTAPSVNTTDVAGAMLVHGTIVEANLPIAVNANGKADVAGRIRFV